MMLKTEKIQRVLFESAEPMALTDIAAAIGEADVPNQVSALVAHLVKLGKVERTARGVYRMTSKGRLWLAEADHEAAGLDSHETRKANEDQPPAGEVALQRLWGREPRRPASGLRAARKSSRPAGSPAEPAAATAAADDQAVREVHGFKIERGVPPPDVRDQRWAELANALQPGDSVLMPDLKQAKRLYLAAKRRSFRVVMRHEDSGVRVWRRAEP